MLRVKKPACDEVRTWGWHMCGMCENSPWPKCGNIEKWHTPTLKEYVSEGWPKNKTRAERIEIQERLKKYKWFQRMSKKRQKKELELSWLLSKPVTMKDKIESYKEFIKLPDYPGPLPSKPGEVQAVFIGKKK